MESTAPPLPDSQAGTSNLDNNGFAPQPSASSSVVDSLPPSPAGTRLNQGQWEVAPLSQVGKRQRL